MVKQQDKRTNTVFLSLGSNLGDRRGHIEKAIALLENLSELPLKVSSFYESDPWGNDALNGFLNCCTQLEVFCTPFELLQKTQEIENAIGRKSKSINGIYTNRVIDIDVLAFGNSTFDSLELTIPHKLMKLRNFVLLPLLELSSDFTLPFEQHSVRAYAENQKEEVNCWRI